MDLTSVLRQSRKCIKEENIHEAIACLERKRFEIIELLSRDEEVGEFKAVESSLDTIKKRLDPLIQELSQDPFKALNASSTSTSAQIKKSYHQLALKYHPDKSKGTEELFKCIQGAFENIRNNKHEKSSASASSMPSKSSNFEEFFYRSERRRQKSAAAVPKGLNIFEATTASITIRWEPPEGYQGAISCYELQWKDSSSSNWKIASNSLKSTVCQKHNLEPDSTYWFRVRALYSHAGTWSSWSRPITASTMSSVPKRPEITNARVDLRSRSIRILWSKPKSHNIDNTLNYSVQWREKGGLWNSPEVSCFDMHIAEYLFSDLQLNQEYEFRVRSKNKIGISGWSNVYKCCLKTEEEKRREQQIRERREQAREEFRSKKATRPKSAMPTRKSFRSDSTDRPHSARTRKFHHPTWSTATIDI